MGKRSAVYVLMELLSAASFYMNLPEELNPYILELCEKCDELIGDGFTYYVDFAENGDKEYHIIPIFRDR